MTVDHEPVPEGDADTDPPSTVEALLVGLTRSARWQLDGVVALGFDAHHPQGLTRCGGLWWLTTVEIAGQQGHVLAFDDGGVLVHDVPVGSGTRFHPGGFDARGEVLTVAVGEYRPDSSTVVVDVDTRTLEVTERFVVDDHLGGLAPLDDGSLFGFTWGSRHLVWLDADGTETKRVANPSHVVDHQDLQILDGAVLCSGVAGLATPGGHRQLGGLAVLDAVTGAHRIELPVTACSPAGRVVTYNPVHTAVDDGGLVVTVVPDDARASLLTYRVA